MANGNAKKVGQIAAGIIYLILVIAAVIVNKNTKHDYAVDASFNLFLYSCIPFAILLFCLTKEDGGFEGNTRKLGGLAVYHGLLWLILIILPFGIYPKLSVILLLFFIIFIGAGIAGVKNEDEYKENNKKSMLGLGKLGKIGLIVIIISIGLLSIYSFTPVGKMIKKHGGDFISSIGFGNSSSSSDGDYYLSGPNHKSGGSDDTYYPEEEKPNQMTATVKRYAYPLDFGRSCPISVNANATLNFSDNIVKAIIYFKSGNIIIESGSVDNINEDGFGSISGSWRQAKTGNSGSYSWVVENEQTGVLTLYSGNTEIATIELYSSSGI